MPLVIVRYDHSRESADLFPSILQELSEKLPGIVAAALTIPSNPAGSLLPKDIAVRFEKSGLLDQNVIDLSILILANDYPERRGNLEERKDAILETIVRDIIPDWYTLSVWILLASGAYGSFAPTD